MQPKLTRHNGPALRAFRVKAGLKTRDLATAAKCSYQQLDNLENERKEASVELLHRIAAELGIPVSALVRDPSFALHPVDRLSA